MSAKEYSVDSRYLCTGQIILIFLTTIFCRAPQSDRMGDLWSLVNFVGAFSNAQNDTKVLLKRIGAWDQFGTGWGDNGDEEIFGATKSRHATNSTSLFSDYFTRSLEHEVEERYSADYCNEKISKALNLDRRIDCAKSDGGLTT